MLVKHKLEEKLNSYFCFRLIWPWAYYLIFLSLNFIIFKVGWLTPLFTSHGTGEITEICVDILKEEFLLYISMSLSLSTDNSAIIPFELFLPLNFCKLFTYLFLAVLDLHSVLGFSLVMASGNYSAVAVSMGLVAPLHVRSSQTQGLDLCLLHGQLDLYHWVTKGVITHWILNTWRAMSYLASLRS